MKKILIILVVITLGLLLSVQGDADTIIVYSSMEQFRGAELQKQLNAKFPELNIMVMYMSTAKAAAKISVEKEQSDADIIVGLESSYLEKIKPVLADISGRSKLAYLDDLAPQKHENRYVTWERQAGAFIIHKDVLAKHHLKTPQTYEDLLDPAFYNLVAMPDPKSSGTGYFFYKNLVNMMGEEAALQYFEKFAYNTKQFTESGSGPIKLLVQGEIAVGLGLTFQGIKEMNDGSPFEIVYPQGGSPYSLTGTALMEKSSDDADVNMVFDFIINDFLVYDKEHFSPEKILKDQVNTIPQYPNDIPYANMQGIDDITEKERLLTVWKY